MDLDELLDLARPKVAPRTETLNDELNWLTRRTRSVSRGRRRVATVAGMATGLIGVSVAGAAAGIGADWVPWHTTTSTGSHCSMEFSVIPWRDSARERTSRPISVAEQDRTAAAARGILGQIDFDAIDKAQAISSWQVEERRVRSAEPAQERQPRLRGNDLELTAVGAVVWKRIAAGLTTEGFDPQAVGFGQAWRCGK